MVTAIVIGLGDRGNIYSSYSLDHRQELEIIAAADPDKEKCRLYANKYGLTNDMVFNSWEDILAKDKFADIAIITTPDNIHFQPAIKAIQQGYDVLLEKPMAPQLEQCTEIIDLSKATDQILQICYVLRFTDFYSKAKRAIDQGKIGDIVNITMMENVSYYHYAHSFIRGNWHNTNESSPMILAKCSHDLDLMYWFANSLPAKISSFGGLDYFKPPRTDLPERCTDGCPIENTCLYFAPRIYIDIIPLLHVSNKGGTLVEKVISKSALTYPNLKGYPVFSRINDYSGWPVSVVTSDYSIEGKKSALENGPYGRCVYKVDDHDVVDHQVVTIKFANSITGTLTMHGHSSEEGRFLRIEGTKGTLVGEFLLSHEKLELIDSLTNRRTVLHSVKSNSGHGGGDMNLIAKFITHVRDKIENNLVSKNEEEALVSHLMAFAAEKARIQGIVVEFDDFVDNRE